MYRRRTGFNDRMEKNPHWHEGERYDISVGDARWYDQGQYHGRAPVWIRDRKTGIIVKRVGDVRIIGNFSPIWVNWKGKSIQIEELLRMK